MAEGGYEAFTLSRDESKRLMRVWAATWFIRLGAVAAGVVAIRRLRRRLDDARP